MKKAHISVANDDTSFLQLMEDLLGEEGYAVTTAEDWHQTYEQIKKAQPDLVILDIHIGGPDTGWQVLNSLKLDPDTNPIPVIVSSADARLMREKEARLHELGCLTLEKPFELEEILALVTAALTPPS